MSQAASKIVVASVGDPRSNATWSGIPAHMCLALERAGVEVVSGGPLGAAEPWYFRWLRSGYWRTGKGWFLSEVEPKILEQRSAALKQIVDRERPDAVVAFHWDPIAAERPSVPTIMVHDATFALLVDYYQAFSGLSKRSIRLGHLAYRRALDHADIAVYSSEWAANSAIRDYGADPKKVHVIEIGANLDVTPDISEVERLIVSRTAAKSHRFLFLGVEWERKGGDDAVESIKRLRNLGVDAYLDVVGCKMPDRPELKEFCTEHGFLNKSNEDDQAKLTHLFESATFLLVPSVTECYGCVYCEANAYGIPAIGRDTGGVGQIIKENVNGFLLGSGLTSIDILAEKIGMCLSDADRYRSLATSSRAEFNDRLNWDRFADRLLALI